MLVLFTDSDFLYIFVTDGEINENRRRSCALFICLFSREGENERRQGKGRGREERKDLKQGPHPVQSPDAGLYPTTLRSYLS